MSKGIRISPELAISDGEFSFYNAARKHWPTARHQRGWVHKTANVLKKVPKSVQSRIKEMLYTIWMAKIQQEAHKPFRQFETRYGVKYPKAAELLTKDKVEMQAFYDCHADHWTHIRTTNHIE
ncbi:transposase [Candidatus Enterovibrio escicola]|uniref:transposase n=1 Tax=Candidatus Enterovibrio escicola TaxID=1927127 RepID=UPI003742F56A